MMVYTCFICKKRSDKSQGSSFHRFPLNSTNRQQWLDIIGKSKEPGKRATVCSDHFTSECFRYGLVNGTKLLKPEAKPTLNLKKQNQDSSPANILNTADESITIDMLDHSDLIFLQVLEQCPENEPLLESYEVESSSQINNIPASKPALQSNIGELAISNKQQEQETPLVEVISKRRLQLTRVTWEELSESPTKGKTLWETAKQELLDRQRKIECLQRKVRRLKQKVSSLKLLMKHLLKKNSVMNNETKFLHSTMDPVAQALFKQIVSKKKISKFPLSLRIFASTLLTLSPKAYVYIRKVFSRSLPHPMTVRKWFTHIDGKLGISKSALQAHERKREKNEKNSLE